MDRMEECREELWRLVRVLVLLSEETPGFIAHALLGAIEERGVEGLVEELAAPIVAVESVKELTTLAHQPGQPCHEKELGWCIRAQTARLGLRGVSIALIRHQGHRSLGIKLS